MVRVTLPAMSFRATQETLEALEWPQLLARLQAECRTGQGARRLEEAARAFRALTEDCEAAPIASPDAALFAADACSIRARLAETSEARALLDADQTPPLGGVVDVGSETQRARKGGVLETETLRDIAHVIETLRQVSQYFARNTELAPRLADRAATLADLGDLAYEIDHCIDPAGEVRDSASSTLAEARRDTQRLGAELQRKLGRYLQDAQVTDYLSDSYFTVRNDRYVLPVKADHKGKVRGIVHDASRTGTTLFVEPEGVVDHNNRLKQAELTVVREIERILRRLSARVGDVAPELEASLEALAAIDVALARGRLSYQMDAVEPEVGDTGVLRLPGLRHPLLPVEACIANDVTLGESFSVLVVSGPNAGGKTVAMKATGLAALLVRAGLHVPCDAGGRVDVFHHVVANIGDGQDIGENLSTFSAHMASLAEIVREVDAHTLVLLDEVGVGTDPSEGAALAQAILERLADADARVIATTHYNLLKEMADVDPRFANASVEFDPETLAPTYRLRLGAPGTSSASAVAARMGMPSTVLERTQALLAREDRQLDRMLSELAASRATLESEQQRMHALRAETESARDAYRTKLERIQARRDALFDEMRADLDRAFKQAHGEVAVVIRDLQRGPTSQGAAEARERLIELAEAADRESAATGRSEPEVVAPQGPPTDWRRAQAGDRVRVDGEREGTLASLPDRKGRVGVHIGSAKLMLPAERVRVIEAPREDADAPSVRSRVALPERPEAAPLGGGTLRCDLRGQRVEEAIDLLAAEIDRAVAEAQDGVFVIHGHGTGALRQAVRAHLRGSPLVAKVRAGEQDEGGEGVTLAELR